MTYYTMDFVPKVRFHALVEGGGAIQRQIRASLEPKKAYADEATRQILEYRITPDNS